MSQPEVLQGEWKMPSERELAAQIEQHAQALANAFAAAEYWHGKALEAIQRQQDDGLSRIEAEYNQATAEAKAGYEQELTTLRAALSQLPWPGLLELGWDAPQWEAFAPDPAAGAAELVRVGLLQARGEYGQLDMPALIPIIGAQNLLIEASGAGKDRARQVIQSIMLRLLATVAPGKLRLVCIDPVGLGATMAGFIKELPDTLTGGQAWFEATHIEKQLADLEMHMATVKQKYLGARYQTIEQYNQDAGEVAEPYRLLVIADFPSRFSDSAVQRLVSIATNGPATGVYVLAMVDLDQKMPYNFTIGDLERTASILVCRDEEDVWEAPDFEKCRVFLDGSPPPAMYERLVHAVGQASLQADDVKVPMSRYAPARADWWQQDSRAELRVAVGRIGAEGVQVFALDEKLLSSALVIGRPGSGKSTLLHTLITNLAIQYSPDNLELYLLDLKQVEFEDYASHQLPHARVVAIQSEREFGLSVLRGLNEELQRRSDLFRDSGFVALSEFRNKTSRRMPRILLIIDEFQELFAEDDAIAREAAQILDRLIRMGRAFGINALLASQTLAGQNALPRSTKDQIPVRIALQSSDADSRLILSDENDRARLLERPGEAIYNAKNGQIEGNSLFQVFWLTPDEREQYLRDLQGQAAQAGYAPSHPPIIFRGNAPGNIEANAQLVSLLVGRGWPEPQRAYSAWLGEPVEIKAHTVALFRRQSRSNLLILGQNQYEAEAVSMLLSGLISLAAQQHPDSASFVLLNLTDVDSPWHDLPAAFAESFPHTIRVARRRDAVSIIREIAAEMGKRLAAADDLRWPALYLAILGLQRGRDLRRDEQAAYRGEDEPTPPAELLASICREGPDVGIHTLLWCDTYDNLERVLDRSPEREFDMRVALQMSGADSRRLIDSELASKIGPYRALYYDEDRTGRAEKFRPYEMPSRAQIERWGQQGREWAT